MSFQGYLDRIKAKTGKGPSDFKRIATQNGWMAAGKLRAEIKASQVVAWLREDFQLGHGHAMAIVALLKGARKEGDQ